MLPCDGAFILVCSHYFRNIVNIVSGRVRISLKSMQLLPFGNLRNKALEPTLFLRFDNFFFHLMFFALL